MAVCSVCGKKPLVGYNVSHSKKKTKRRYLPNIQKIKTIDDKGTVSRVYVCAKCLKAGKVKKPTTIKRSS